MKLLWICGLPYEVQREALQGRNCGASAAWSWVLGHLPPPAGIELHIACRTARHTAPEEFDYRGARFHLVPVQARARVYCLFQFDWRYYRALASRLNPDVVHGWGTEDAYALTATRLSPDRHLVQVQGNLNAYRRRVPMPWSTVLAAWNERRVLARARHVVAENQYSLDAARPMIRTASVHVVEHPIRPVFLTAPPGDGRGRQILFVGAIQERKGIGDALTAFRNGAPPDWTLGIIGGGEAATVARLRQTVAEAGLESRVRHYPQLTAGEIVALMQSASVFLLPTRIDTGPTALKEALAMGLWPVCYDNSGPAHYLRRFQYGDLAPDLDVTGLTAVLQQALAREEWLAPAHRDKVQTRIRPQFDRVNIWADLTTLYREIIQSSAGG
ncbi:glycosyltransferase [bacterium]|nr:glycosyltransferase [bacterium]